jgi:acyl carrier protein
MNPSHDPELQAVKELAAAALHVPPAELEEGTPLSAYGVNSVDMIDITVKLETMFGIQFDPEKLVASAPSCRSLAAMVQALRQQQGIAT